MSFDWFNDRRNLSEHLKRIRLQWPEWTQCFWIVNPVERRSENSASKKFAALPDGDPSTSSTCRKRKAKNRLRPERNWQTTSVVNAVVFANRPGSTRPAPRDVGWRLPRVFIDLPPFAFVSAASGLAFPLCPRVLPFETISGFRAESGARPVPFEFDRFPNRDVSADTLRVTLL